MNKKKVQIMGIVNITDDSYFSVSRAFNPDAIYNRTKKLISEGADIIDIGACSTRPGSKYVSEAEEWNRISMALEVYKSHFSDVPLSVDTFRSSIAIKTYDKIGHFMVNDISAGEEDDAMLPLVGKLGLDYVAMHKRGVPANMQQFCQYENVTKDIIKYFEEFALKAKDAGLKDWIVDPGFGFSKNIDQNYELLEHLEDFQSLGHKILIGISRKSFIYKKLGITPEEALPATSKLHIKAIEKGADILRVHDVAEAAKIIYLCQNKN